MSGKIILKNPFKSFKNQKVPISFLIGCVFIFFCSIPWVNFGLNKMDSQPWPIFFAFFFILLSVPLRKDLNFSLFLLYVALGGIFFSLILWPFETDFYLLRGLVNYVGVVLIFLGFVVFLKKYTFPFNILFYINLVYVLVGLIEVFSPSVTKYFVVGRTTLERGTTSLTPEPTFFAIYLFFNAWLLFVGNNYILNKKLYFIMFLNFFAIIALAKSAMGALFIIISLIFILCIKLTNFKNSLRYLIRFSFVFIFIFLILRYSVDFFENSRILKMVTLASQVSILELFEIDASFNVRLANVVLPIHGFFLNSLLPGGFYTFDSISSEFFSFYRGYFWYGIGRVKIMSWIGSCIYELGVFGLVFLFVLFRSITFYSKKRILEILLLFLILLSAIPLAFPLVPMLFAVYYVNCKPSYQIKF